MTLGGHSETWGYRRIRKDLEVNIRRPQIWTTFSEKCAKGGRDNSNFFVEQQERNVSISISNIYAPDLKWF